MLDALRQFLLYAASLGFGYLFWLHIRTGMFWRAPFFACYSATAFIYGLLYSPYNTAIMFSFTPLLLSLRISMAIEAFVLATETISPKEKRWAILATVFPTVVIILIVMALQFYAGDSPLDWYHSARLYVHVGLAAAAFFGAFTLWVEPPTIPGPIKAHGLTMICYFLSHAIINVGMPATSAEWQYLSCVSLASCCVCIWYWLRRGLTSRVQPLFKVIHPTT